MVVRPRPHTLHLLFEVKAFTQILDIEMDFRGVLRQLHFYPSDATALDDVVKSFL
jgi:hypothetical protein